MLPPTWRSRLPSPSPCLPWPVQVNSELKKFGHINRKALDQYMNFTEQRDELCRRKDVRRGGHAHAG